MTAHRPPRGYVCTRCPRHEGPCDVVPTPVTRLRLLVRALRGVA